MDMAERIVPFYDFIICQLLNFIKSTKNTETCLTMSLNLPIPCSESCIEAQ